VRWDHPTAPRSPWQNGYAERVIGSIRRESLDHVIVFGEAHLRRVLKAYASYYNQVRTHLSLNKEGVILKLDGFGVMKYARARDKQERWATWNFVEPWKTTKPRGHCMTQRQK
jgi:hypothetical protein